MPTLIEYDRSPGVSTEQRLNSLANSVQRALTEIEDSVEFKAAKTTAPIKSGDSFANLFGQILKNQTDAVHETLKVAKETNPEMYIQASETLNTRILKNYTNEIDYGTYIQDNGDNGSASIILRNSIELEDKIRIRVKEGDTDAVYRLYGQHNLFPVGSLYITKTNVNPSSILGFGTWALRKKRFANLYQSTDSNLFTHNTANVSSNTVVANRNSDNIDCVIGVTTKVAIGDTTVELGTLNLNKLGVASLTMTHRLVGWSDGGNSIIMLNISPDGILSSVDTVPNTLPADSSAFVTVNFAIHNVNKLDSACDEFLWERTG